MTTEVPRLGVLYINPAGGCNLHCKHCWVNEGTLTGELLTRQLWEKLLSEAKEEGCSFLKYTGGEPLMYTEFVPLYRFSATLFDKVVIETNGTLEPEGLWDAFNESKPYHVSVSLDNSNPKLHDEFRGQSGAWRKSVSFSQKLVEYGINNQVIMSVSDTKREPILDMVKLLESIGVFSLKINFITPAGRGKNHSFYDSGSLQETLDFFSWIDRETPKWVLPAIPAALLPLNRLVDLGYCPVRNLMGVLPDGTFSLCGVAFSREEMAWGKFPETSVKEAWENSPIYRLVRSSVPENLGGICQRCMHRDSCIGRCVANNLETGGSLTSPDILCQKAYEAGLFPKSRIID